MRLAYAYARTDGYAVVYRHGDSYANADAYSNAHPRAHGDAYS